VPAAPIWGCSHFSCNRKAGNVTNGYRVTKVGVGVGVGGSGSGVSESEGGYPGDLIPTQTLILALMPPATVTQPCSLQGLRGVLESRKDRTGGSRRFGLAGGFHGKNQIWQPAEADLKTE
jgi:hypothetical protein